ncbi:Putative glucose-6-phosphate 1-epimerase (Putative D-hexose-6-phosphate mutarotase) (Putative apospory-associated protein C) [Durusdinium trenchii]|uniref:Glucose-6-phosphate 1-epimerase (Putative D-hexose-6-phosphate mutarotase) (Putative apospory-associated protein C) n=1 Tax=Durusdinium trenchii TaxID=1381693 RepID=A0ABP0IWT2_9DINO
MDWTFVEGESSDGKCVLELVDSEETKKAEEHPWVWPFEFRCTYTVELTDGELATTMKVENLSESECTFTTGIHSYFATSDIDKLGIVGKFKGCTYEDPVQDRTKDPPTPVDYDKDEIKIAEFRDEIYKKVWPSTVTLQDPEKGDLDIISDGGWRDLVVWNPYGDDKMGYKTFVCVESVECDPISLAAGSSWEATVNVVPRK